MSNKLYIDIEAMDPKLHNYQRELYTAMAQHISYGKEFPIIMAGRNVGKSNFSAVAMQRLWDSVMNRPIEELRLDERRVAGAKYYTVEPIGGAWHEMEAWCLQTFGEAAEVWDIKSSDESFIWPELGRWYKNNRKFWFRNVKDRDWFVIRWNA